MNVLAKITLNFQQPNFITVYAAQNDRLSRYINAALLDGATPWTLPTGALMTVKYRRGDGVGGFYDTLEDDSPACAVESDGTVTIGLAEQLLAVAGVAAVELRFYNAAGEVLSTATFRVVVQPSAWADEDIVESEPYINVLSQQIAAVLEAAADLTGITVSATTGAAGSSATATVTGGTGGQPYNIAFTIPRGNTGATPNLTIGTVETVSSADQASASISGTTKNPKLNLSLPRGVDGTGAVSKVMNVSPDNTTHDVPAEQLFNKIYPIGAIYISTSSTNPGTLFGGTWAQITGRFLLASGATDPQDPGSPIYTAGATGGAASVDMHTSGVYAGAGFVDTAKLGFDSPDGLLDNNFTPSHVATGVTVAAGSDTARGVRLFGDLDTMPPYLAVYVWQRTALAS